jgi:hypothetical protein
MWHTLQTFLSISVVAKFATTEIVLNSSYIILHKSNNYETLRS